MGSPASSGRKGMAACLRHTTCRSRDTGVSVDSSGATARRQGPRRGSTASGAVLLAASLRSCPPGLANQLLAVCARPPRRPATTTRRLPGRDSRPPTSGTRGTMVESARETRRREEDRS
jgi:hypothetical protein